MGIIWKKIEKDWLKYNYMISNTGVVKRLSTDMWIKSSIKGEYMTNRPDKIMKSHISSGGYLRISLQTKSGSSMFFIHRLIAEVFIPNPDNKPMVNHKNGNKLDFRIDNLEWVTASENEKHAYDNNLKFGQRGSKNPMAKLSEYDVREIKKRLKNGDKPLNISKDYNTNKMNIYKIKSGIRWNHIEI